VTRSITTRLWKHLPQRLVGVLPDRFEGGAGCPKRAVDGGPDPHVSVLRGRSRRAGDGAPHLPTLRPLHQHALALAIALLALAFCPWCAQAVLSSTAFETANKLYEEGKFAEAASAYEELTKSGEASAALYFNLGNAFFKSGQIGRAIAAYRQAEQISPRDPDLRANLQFARNQTPSPTLAPSRWQLWLSRLTLNEWTLLAAGALWLWLLLLALLQWRPTLKPTLRGYLYVIAAIGLLLSACVLLALRQTRFTRTAIVVVREATVRFGPLSESPSAFTVHDGAELRVLDQKDEWLQVSAGPRRTGWLRRDQTLVH
jgi:tetratricopeptide (TPR) repeat protein